MTRILVSATLILGLALLLPAPGRAQTTIQASNGQCLGLDPDGRSVILTSCYLGLQVSWTYGGPIVVDRGNGRVGCIDGYRGEDNALEVVVCDGTLGQNWGYDDGGFFNIGTLQCMHAGSKVESAVCTSGARRQRFTLGDGAAPVARSEQGRSRSGSFGSGTSQPAPEPPPIALSPAGGELMSDAGTSLIGEDSASLIGEDSASLIGHDGSTLIGHDGSTLVGNSGNTVLPSGAGNMSNSGGIISNNAQAGIIGNTTGMVAAGGLNDQYGIQAVDEAPASIQAQGEGGHIVIGGLCLNQSGNSSSGYYLTIADCGSASRFFWSDGNIVNPATGLCIDGIEGAAKVGGREEDQSVRPVVKFYNCDTSGEQNWQMHEFNGTDFFIRNERFGLCMDVDGGVIAPGRTVLLWKCYEPYRPQNQLFTIIG